MSKGELTIIEGDATDPQTTYPNEIALIPHCCNNLGGWGAGFVVALSKKWPEPEKVYREFHKNNKEFPMLGKVCYAEVNSSIIVANMIGQNGYKSDTNPTPVKYRALAEAMAGVAAYVSFVQSKTDNRVVIHAPKFGSDLAGGDWNFIMELIRELWLDVGIDVVVYEFVPPNQKVETEEFYIP